MATLLLERRNLSHKELSNLTGYSISSVSRTLDQMIRMGIVHKHKDASRKHFVFHISADFPEMTADGMEKILRVYKAQREKIKNLTHQVRGLESKEEDKVEIDHLQTTLEDVANMIEFVEDVMKRTIRELRTP